MSTVNCIVSSNETLLSYFSVQCMHIQHTLLCVCLTHSPLTMRTQSTHILCTYTNVCMYAVSNGMYYTFLWNTLGEFAASPFGVWWLIWLQSSVSGKSFTLQHHQLLSVTNHAHSSTYTILHYHNMSTTHHLKGFYFQILHKGFSLKIHSKKPYFYKNNILLVIYPT